MKRFRASLLIAPVAALIFVFVILPYVTVLIMSFRATADGQPYGQGFSVEGYQQFFSQPYYALSLPSSLALGMATTLVCLILGYPIALHIATASRKWRGLLYGIVLSPLLVGIVVRSYGWTILLGNSGVINATLRNLGLIDRPLPLMYNNFGVVLALAHVFLPFMVLPLLSSLQSIDPAIAQAARSLGARRFTIFRRVTFPVSMPGVQAGCILVFVLAISSYVTPSLVGGMRVKTTTLLVIDALIDQYQWPFGSAMALILAVSAGLVVLIFARLTRMKWT
ncbi:ABC transporter permease [Pseudooceanicola sediminis]|uniref:ABC transporter permease n=1 Tax=Pseudooceanicola sediminis TaxID=2211117 RepID=A0A399J4Y3_9RHOB|nr:ABC transporter permease [Pseudooceanicola sediminis]KAA2317293.1 ABC transporter permease [Puniceibacterium sp. HSS470]RII39647.1 ABC transporter permease [Pseudooceanicola sediminis]|tara:strand:+ start:26197 stop:27036 length:840 start_codon:yes stop_codon:yes gene_type:complete